MYYQEAASHFMSLCTDFCISVLCCLPLLPAELTLFLEPFSAPVLTNCLKSSCMPSDNCLTGLSDVLDRLLDLTGERGAWYLCHHKTDVETSTLLICHTINLPISCCIQSFNGQCDVYGRNRSSDLQSRIHQVTQ